jgi:asparagine synthase (glutamine-hydrolysing)
VWREPDAFPEEFFFIRALFTHETADELLRDARPEEKPDWESWLEGAARQAARLDSFSAVTWLEARSYMVNTLLRDTDCMSMAHSLEVRVPFLDHPLVEFMAALPVAAKHKPGVPKALLVESLRDVLPAEVASKPKQTFTLPWERWLRGALRERMAAGLGEPAAPLRGVLHAPAVRSVWQQFLDGRTSWSRPWSLYVLNEWARRHLREAN